MGFLSAAQRQRLQDAVASAERQTSGEIVVCLTRHTKGDIYEAAKAFFIKKGLQATEARNGVLIMLAYRDHKLAILGDEGIDAKVPDDFWESTVAIMTARFAQDDIVGGLEAGIAEIGRQLSAWFPWQKDDVNELSDEIHVDDGENH